VSKGCSPLLATITSPKHAIKKLERTFKTCFTTWNKASPQKLALFLRNKIPHDNFNTGTSGHGRNENALAG